MNKTQLSARWTHPERDGILVDRIVKGDVSSWAHATSKPFGSQFKPVRPEVGRVRAAFVPVRSLKSIAVLDEVKKELALRNPHDPNSVVTPFQKGQREVAKAIKECDETIELVAGRLAASNRLNKAFLKAARKSIKAKPQPIPGPASDPLADCPRTSPEVLARLRDNVMPRDL